MRRSGATLTEVLIGLLILSIGVISIAALFPIATLRAIKATQLTNATDLRYNAETMLVLYPFLISDPDRNGNIDEHNPPAPGDPNLARYVVDPLFSELPQPENAWFGNGVALGLDRRIPRYSLAAAGVSPITGTTARERNQTYAVRPFVDSWSRISEGNVPNFTPTQADVQGLDVTTGITDASGALLPGVFRVVLWDADRRVVQTRKITNVTGQTIFWTDDLDGDGGAPEAGEDPDENMGLDLHRLPPSFVPDLAQIESQELRYSWLLTFRHQYAGEPSSVADVDVVIYFRRQYEDPADDERLWTMPGPAAPGNVGGFTTGRNQVLFDPGTGQPNLKKGGYCFDADNAYWYRIRDFGPAGAASPSATAVIVTLDTSARAGSNTAGGLVMFPRNIVDVYSLGQKAVTP